MKIWIMQRLKIHEKGPGERITLQQLLYQLLTGGTLLYGITLLFQMDPAAVFLSGISLFIFSLIFQKGREKEKMQKMRFEEVSIYLDTIMYAFDREAKLIRALEAAGESMQECTMKNRVENTLEHMQMISGDSDLQKEALEMLEKDYPCRRMQNIHRFMLHVEEYGGNIAEPLMLLREDKYGWESRIRCQMKENRHMFYQVAGSVLVSLGICSMTLYFPDMGISLSSNSFSQGMSALVLLLDEVLLLRAQSYLTGDWLTVDQPDQKEEALQLKRLQEYRSCDRKKEAKKSLLWASLPAAAFLFFLIRRNSAGVLLSSAAVIICSGQHRIGRHLAKRKLIQQIKLDFPNWLLDMLLLLQSENVQMALEKSLERSPELLKGELTDLSQKMALAPESPVSYHSFLQDFDLPEVHAVMSMLYSFSAGNSRNVQKQFAALIRLNQEMLGEADTVRMKNKSSGLYLLFLAPVFTASVKLLADMTIYLLGFMSVNLMK